MISKSVYRNPDEASGYLGMLERFYGNNQHFQFFFSDIVKALQHTIASPWQESVFFRSDGKKGTDCHICLSIDSRLAPGIALFGFFECINDCGTFEDLWNSVTLFAGQKGIERLVGPINSSTFYQYRFNTCKHASFPPFLSEPLHKSYYYELFSKLENGSESKYYSGLRTSFNKILQATAESYTEVRNRDFAIEEYPHPGPETVRELYILSDKIFENNRMYLPIPESDFSSLYDNKKISECFISVYICRKEGNAIAFALTLAEGNKLIIKTLGVDSEYQSQGIGNALVYMIHKHAKDKGFTEVIYALIDEENRVKYFTREDARVIREYVTFNISLEQ